jgi:hypothetical protein
MFPVIQIVTSVHPSIVPRSRHRSAPIQRSHSGGDDQDHWDLTLPWLNMHLTSVRHAREKGRKMLAMKQNHDNLALLPTVQLFDKETELPNQLQAIMSMTLWVHTLEGRQFTSHEDDHTILNLHAEVLDGVCGEMGVTPISSFLDYTDLNANMSDESDGEDVALDPETGWSYGITDMTWFSARAGLSTFASLRQRIIEKPPEALPELDVSKLLAEIDSCIHKLEGPAERDGQFHLAVVM